MKDILRKVLLMMLGAWCNIGYSQITTSEINVENVSDLKVTGSVIIDSPNYGEVLIELPITGNITQTYNISQYFENLNYDSRHNTLKVDLNILGAELKDKNGPPATTATRHYLRTRHSDCNAGWVGSNLNWKNTRDDWPALLDAQMVGGSAIWCYGSFQDSQVRL